MITTAYHILLSFLGGTAIAMMIHLFTQEEKITARSAFLIESFFLILLSLFLLFLGNLFQQGNGGQTPIWILAGYLALYVNTTLLPYWRSRKKGSPRT
jgi:hypothetical protein